MQNNNHYIHLQRRPHSSWEVLSSTSSPPVASCNLSWCLSRTVNCCTWRPMNLITYRHDLSRETARRCQSRKGGLWVTHATWLDYNYATTGCRRCPSSYTVQSLCLSSNHFHVLYSLTTFRWPDIIPRLKQQSTQISYSGDGVGPRLLFRVCLTSVLAGQQTSLFCSKAYSSCEETWTSERHLYLLLYIW